MSERASDPGACPLKAAGKKVALRPPCSDDYPQFVRWQNDPEVARWMDYRQAFDLATVERDQARATTEGHPFTIEAEGRPIGKAGLNRFRARVCGLYLYIGERDLWGRGFGRDAVMALCAVAFDRFGVDAVELSAFRDNARARRVYEACGFEGTGEAVRERGSSGVSLTMRLDRERFARLRAEYGL